MSKRYIPEVGDIIHVHFDAGLQAPVPDYKPAVVLSPQAYNKRTGLILCCPITGHANGYPFEVPIDNESAILSDQVKSLSWANSRISHHGRVNPPQLAQIRAKLHALIFND